MAHSRENFSFTWKIENFTMLPHQTGEYLESATFVVETLMLSKWYVRLFPKGIKTRDYINCVLYSVDQVENPIPTGFSFALESTQASFETMKTDKILNDRSRNYGILCLNASNLSENKHLYLPKDVFTLRCCLWPLDKLLMAPLKPIVVPNSFNRHCSSVTRIKVVKKSFTWSITKIDKLIQSHGKMSVTLKSALKDSPSLELSLSISDSKERYSEASKQNEINEKSNEVTQDEKDVQNPDKDDIQNSDKENVQNSGKDDAQNSDNEDVHNSDKEYVEVEIRQTHSRIGMEHLFVRSKLTVLSADKQYQHSKEDTHLFNSNLEDIWHFPAFILVKNLVDNKYIYIDDTLILQCDFAFSQKGTNYNVELPEYEPWSFRNKKASKVNELNGSIRHLYLSEKFCDVSIRAGLKIFQAHKIVLCARSSVFNAMFEINMKEKDTNVVDISDVEPDTMGRFLRFLHSDILEKDMTLEDTCKLYSAADKYQVFLLKQQCSILLLSTLSVSSVCDILVCADAHSNSFLLSVIHNFLHSHSTETFHSTKWKSYIEHYPKLFGDIMIKIFMEE